MRFCSIDFSNPSGEPIAGCKFDRLPPTLDIELYGIYDTTNNTVLAFGASPSLLQEVLVDGTFGEEKSRHSGRRNTKGCNAALLTVRISRTY